MPRLCFCWTIVELLGSLMHISYVNIGHDIAWSPSRFGTKETAQWLHMVFTSWPYLASLLPVGFIRFGPEMSPVSGKPNGKTFPSKVVPQGILHFTCSTFTNLTIVIVTINPTVKLAIKSTLLPSWGTKIYSDPFSSGWPHVFDLFWRLNLQQWGNWQELPPGGTSRWAAGRLCATSWRPCQKIPVETAGFRDENTPWNWSRKVTINTTYPGCWV